MNPKETPNPLAELGANFLKTTEKAVSEMPGIENLAAMHNDGFSEASEAEIPVVIVDVPQLFHRRK